ncbi:MAG: HEPN domain-containing protein [Prevotellaceae bacterium]|jgi:uncharacterized protein (UPF0332 family)|nr:HEPN domain-containing protein [Prevotellaceae bacterium]
MKLKKDERAALTAYRLQRAKETLTEVKGNVEMGFWHTAANRLYYACYYALNGLLIDNGLTARTHEGVLRMLGLHFVSKGIISKEDNKLYSRLFDLRLSGDYDDWIVIEEEDIKPLLAPAEQFINTIERLISNK